MKLTFQPTFVLASSVFCLILLFYFGRLPFFYRHFAQYFPDDPDVRLYAHLWLAGSSVLTRTVLPLLFIVFVFRQRPRDWGYRVRGTTGLTKIYVGLALFMLPLLYWASTMDSFGAKYPMYKGVDKSVAHFLVYEASYFLVFLSGESFWRGYMVFGLKKAFGYYGIAIMTIPYVMIHFGKPFPEAMGALITGCILGYLALKHRSFWLGVALHFTVALTMDVLALWQSARPG